MVQSRVYIPRNRRGEMSVFFFQAKDGIRDYKVTGVQTCALPICKKNRHTLRSSVCGGVLDGLASIESSSERSIKPRVLFFLLGLCSPVCSPVYWTLNQMSLCTKICKITRSEEHTSELQSPCNLVCR